jgi:uncharacterized protein DUF87
MSQPVGIVVDATDATIQIRLKSPEVVVRGEMLATQDDSHRYIMRVTNIRTNKLLSEGEVAKISRLKSENQNVEIPDEEARCFKVASAVLVAQFDSNGKPHPATSCPGLFTSVETITDDDCRSLGFGLGDIEIGLLRAGHQASSWPVRVSGWDVFRHHLLICSATGGGKTNLGKNLARSVMEADNGRYSLVVIDTESEYLDGGDSSHFGLIHLPKSENHLLLVTSEVERPQKLQRLIEIDGKTYSRTVNAYPLQIFLDQIHPADVIETGEFTHAQEALMWLSLSRKHANWISFLLEESMDQIYQQLGGRVHRSTIAVTKRKLGLLVTGDGMFRSGRSGLDLIRTILGSIRKGKVVLVDMVASNELQERLLTLLIGRRVFSYYEYMKKTRTQDWETLPTCTILLEEAHQYLSREKALLRGGSADNVFSTISKRGRKYHVGLCCITQMPSELPEQILRQQLTKIILPLPTQPDYLTVERYTPYLAEAAEEVRSLDRGEALLVSPPAGTNFVLPVRIRRFEETVVEAIAKENVAVLEATTKAN